MAEEMLLCDECDGGFHIYCLRPPLRAVPEGDWVCQRCQNASAERRRRRVQKPGDKHWLPSCLQCGACECCSNGLNCCRSPLPSPISGRVPPACPHGDPSQAEEEDDFKIMTEMKAAEPRLASTRAMTSAYPSVKNSRAFARRSGSSARRGPY